MKILTAPNWPDYQLIDSGDGQRLERFGKYTLVRPDPQILWHPHLSRSEWEKADAVFENDKWKVKNKVPNIWLMHWENLTFQAKLTPFKHTGVFPEQTVQWEWIKEKINKARGPVNILNLFAYTGIASLVAVSAGARVTHVDASRPAIGWAKENQVASKLEDKPIRWILDDATKFVQREIRRGSKYDAVIMDPPVYGHGPSGQRWDFNKDFPYLLESCRQLLSENPIFILINAYAISSSALMLENVLNDLKLDGQVEAGELALREAGSDRLLSTGIFGQWSYA